MREALFLEKGGKRWEKGGSKEEGEREKERKRERERERKTAAGKQVPSIARDDRYVLLHHPRRVARGNKRSYIL